MEMYGGRDKQGTERTDTYARTRVHAQTHVCTRTRHQRASLPSPWPRAWAHPEVGETCSPGASRTSRVPSPARR